MRIHIIEGRVVDPSARFDQVADICLENGKISSIGKKPKNFETECEINAKNLIVCPGLIDLSVKLNIPGRDVSSSIESELNAAICGGVTSICCLPDMVPPLDESGIIDTLNHKVKKSSSPKIYPIGALTKSLKGERLTEMADLSEAGCVAFSQGDEPLPNVVILERAMKYASTFDIKLWLRPQECSYSNHGFAHEGHIATKLGLNSLPPVAELVAVSTIILLAQQTKCRVHLYQLSSRGSVELVDRAKKAGVNITADISVNHLHLTEENLNYFDTNCKTIPPLRSTEDKEALREALSDGVIDVICSNHTPVDIDGKSLPFGEAVSGVSGVEFLLPLTLKWALEEKVSMLEALSKITANPARVMGNYAYGLSVGSSADLIIFDPSATKKILTDRMHSVGRNTPFAGSTIAGEVIYTIIDGSLVYDRDKELTASEIRIK